MKFFTLGILALALAGSFYWSGKHGLIPQSVHQEIQAQFRVNIRNYILSQRPELTNFQIHKAWTEALSPKEIRLDFQYSFENPQNDSQKELEGYAIFEKQSGKEEELWILSQFHILKEALSLNENFSVRLPKE